MTLCTLLRMKDMQGIFVQVLTLIGVETMPANSPTVRPKRKGIALQRFFINTHIGLYRRTNGAIGGRMAGRSMLLLTTIGRKSGLERTTPLQYMQDGNDYLLMASDGGAPQDPQWCRNLVENPQAKIQVGSNIIDVTTRKANPEERSRLWPIIIEKSQEFAGYQKKMTREIPIIILTPKASDL
jgi:F420H(2)-dependent quinone reductase